MASARSGTVWGVAAVVLLILGAGSLAVGLETRHDVPGLVATAGVSPTSAPTTHDHPSPAARATSPGATALAVSRSTPVAVRIPALHLAVPLSALGLNPDRTVQVPTDPDEPGWYRFGPTPGQLGSAVILGHVDSYQGPAVFYQLSSLTRGDDVSVRLANGLVTHFVVSTVVTYPNADFPARKVYGPHGFSGLHLVTCGGGFDAAAGHYLGNVVVYAHLVHVSRTPSA